jgi:hypothetical protein
MTARLEVLVTFIVYLLFFAWIGWRRGFRPELIVFCTALIAWIVLQEFGDIFVRLANLAGLAVRLVTSGGLSGDPEVALAAIRSAPPVITEQSRPGFLFILWVIVVVLAYIVSSWPHFKGKRDAGLNGWAILLGMANGLLFASIFLPRLVALLTPEGTPVVGLAAETSLFGFLIRGVRLLFENLSALWALIRPQSSIVLLLMLTLFLVLVASTLRTGAKAKS